jgi:hypothetical protein
VPSFEHDYGYLKAGLKGLEPYLLASDVYWPLGASAPAGDPPYPMLTLGGILLTDARLNALPLQPVQIVALQKLQSELNALKTHWRVTWEKKAAHEFSARLRLWAAYLEEMRLQPENHIDRYAFEVSRRVMLALLQEQSAELPKAETDLLSSLDGLLRILFAEGDFVWEEVYRRAFPKEKFWYLYGQIKQGRGN